MNIPVTAPNEMLSDKELVYLARGGNTSAFSVLSERYMPLLKSRAARYSSVVGVDTEDFVQEGMLALFKAVKGFDASAGIQFKTYATTCVNNSMATAIKTHMKNAWQSAGISIDGFAEEKYVEASIQHKPKLIEDMFIEQEDSAKLALQIQALLSNFEQQVLKLYLQGLSYLQIAEQLGAATKAVDNALQRVRRKIRPHL